MYFSCGVFLKLNIVIRLNNKLYKPTHKIYYTYHYTTIPKLYTRPFHVCKRLTSGLLNLNKNKKLRDKLDYSGKGKKPSITLYLFRPYLKNI